MARARPTPTRFRDRLLAAPQSRRGHRARPVHHPLAATYVLRLGPSADSLDKIEWRKEKGREMLTIVRQTASEEKDGPETTRPRSGRTYPVCDASTGSRIRPMKATVACAQSQYLAAVRQHNGKPMIYSSLAGRVFLQTSVPGAPPEFQEVKREYVDSFLNYADWQPWDKPLPEQGN